MELNIIAVTQARMGSSRLPGKVLLNVEGKSLLEIHVERIKRSRLISDIIIATTVETKDDVLNEYVIKKEWNSFRGSEMDVLDRFFNSVQPYNPDYVVRLTSDCPLIDAELIDKVIQFAIDNQLDYASNVFVPNYPDGLDVEVFTFKALAKAWKEANLNSDREHVTPYIRRNSTFNDKSMFSSMNFSEGYSYEHMRLTVDEQRDFELISSLIEQLGIDKPWIDYVKFLEDNPQIQHLNSGIIRNEGYIKSIQKDK